MAPYQVLLPSHKANSDTLLIQVLQQDILAHLKGVMVNITMRDTTDEQKLTTIILDKLTKLNKFRLRLLE